MGSLKTVWMRGDGYFQGDPPEARCGHVAACIKNHAAWGDEFIVIHGGINKDRDALDSLVVLGLEQGSWVRPSSPNAQGPAARAFHAGAVLGRCLWVFGGHVFVRQQSRLHTYGDLWCLDSDTWEWRRAEVDPGAPAPCPRDRASLAAAPGGGRLLLYGGADSANRRLDDLWAFDLGTGAWTELTPVSGHRPRARCSATLCTLANRLLLFGGDAYGVAGDLWSLKLSGGEGVVTESRSSTKDDNGKQPNESGGTTRDSQKTKQLIPSWTPLTIPGAAPASRRGHAAAVSEQGVVVQGGWTECRSLIGIKSRGACLDDTFLLDRRGDGLAWTAAARLPDSAPEDAPCAREKHSLTSVSDGRLLLFGGTDGRTTMNDLWWLRLETIVDVVDSASSARPRVPSPLPTPRPGDEGPSPGAGRPTSPVQQAGPAPSSAQVSPGGAATWLPSATTMPGLGYLPAVPLGLTSAFSSLRDRLGLPGGAGVQAAALAPLGVLGNEFDPGLIALGERVLGGHAATDRTKAAQAARSFLATCTPEELRLGDVPVLLTDYRRLARAGFAAALKTDGELPETLPGRFMHLRAGDLRMQDVPLMLDEYRALLTEQFGAVGKDTSEGTS